MLDHAVILGLLELDSHAWSVCAGLRGCGGASSH